MESKSVRQLGDKLCGMSLSQEKDRKRKGGPCERGRRKCHTTVGYLVWSRCMYNDLSDAGGASLKGGSPGRLRQRRLGQDGFPWYPHQSNHQDMTSCLEGCMVVVYTTRKRVVGSVRTSPDWQGYPILSHLARASYTFLVVMVLPQSQEPMSVPSLGN
jgi:hypothetical protein